MMARGLVNRKLPSELLNAAIEVSLKFPKTAEERGLILPGGFQTRWTGKGVLESRSQDE